MDKFCYGFRNSVYSEKEKRNKTPNDNKIQN